MMSSAMNPIVSPGITSEGLCDDVIELLCRLTIRVRTNEVVTQQASFGGGSTS
jgi:hypothetical protein